MTHHTRMQVERVTAPAIEPLSLAQVKLFLRVEHAEDDALIMLCLTAAREAAEAVLGRSLITQSQRFYAPACSTLIALPRGPVQTIQTVAIEDADGGVETLDADTYRLHAGRGILQLDAVPSGQTLIITYVTGYGDEAEDVPSLIRQGILQHVAALYEAREAQIPMPNEVRAFYLPYREVRL